jgi:hypothetical protein
MKKLMNFTTPMKAELTCEKCGKSIMKLTIHGESVSMSPVKIECEDGKHTLTPYDGVSYFWNITQIPEGYVDIAAATRKYIDQLAAQVTSAPSVAQDNS